MGKTVKFYSHVFFRNSLIAGAADVNVLEFRNVEGGARRKLLSLTNFVLAIDNVTLLQQAVNNLMPAVGQFILPTMQVQEILSGVPGRVKFVPEVVTPAAGVGNGSGGGLNLNINEKTSFLNFDFNEGVRITCGMDNRLPVNDIYYRMVIYVEIEAFI